MLENLTDMGYEKGDSIIFVPDMKEKDGDFPLETLKEWAFYEIDKKYNRVLRNLTLTYENYTVSVSAEHIDEIGRTLELMEHNREQWGSLDLADGDYDHPVSDDMLRDIRMNMIEKLDDLQNIKRKYMRMVVRATDKQTIRSIKLDFSQKGM